MCSVHGGSAPAQQCRVEVLARCKRATTPSSPTTPRSSRASRSFRGVRRAGPNSPSTRCRKALPIPASRVGRARTPLQTPPREGCAARAVEARAAASGDRTHSAVLPHRSPPSQAKAKSAAKVDATITSRVRALVRCLPCDGARSPSAVSALQGTERDATPRCIRISAGMRGQARRGASRMPRNLPPELSLSNRREIRG